jgi:uncharacterized damage-inducible protein DinB
MRRILSLLAPALLVPAGLSAQANPVSNVARAMIADLGKNLLAAARAMPADKYGYKPTPAQMTFGGLIAHIDGDNRITCAGIGGARPPAGQKLKPDAAKDSLVGALERSISFCNTALAHASDAGLGERISYYGQRAPRAAAMIGLIADWADHYGQQAMYLRLNGVLPPTAAKP